jgi:two-component system C4-dicarboxylate transport sensor histidine kinase DctB
MWRRGMAVLGFGLIAAILASVYMVAAARARADLLASAEAQLQIIALDLESALEKFETLPYALALQPAAAQVLAQPDDAARVQQLNLTLQSVQRHAKVAAIYLMDRDGKTLAASNWDKSGGFNYMGKNFGFRPYFRNAMAGAAGRFYGIGSTTSEPGYFIAQPVYARHPTGAAGAGGGAEQVPLGVMAVKISLDEFEQNWRSSPDPIALADHSGVIFLSNRAAWKYHSLAPLGAAVEQELAGTQQYLGRRITPVADGQRLGGNAVDGVDGNAVRTVGRLGWRLQLFAPQARIARAANLSVLAAALLLAIAALGAVALQQRARRLADAHTSRQALRQAARELDDTIARRTRELRDANVTLEQKYRTLEQTEQVLRSTQNELVQAGKLAMLGQMAAGVTHELNQPLAAIRAFADNAQTFLARGQSASAGENLAHISAASARMGAIIGQLKGFARKSDAALVSVDLAQSIQASAFLLQGEFRRLGVELTIASAVPLRVIGNAGRIEQVLINLLRNALDAVGEPDAGAAPRPTPQVRVTLMQSDAWAVIVIHDSGPGLGLLAVDHLFEPFFTTKPSGQGLGLGLAISSSIVQAMDGSLEARNHPDGGAEFSVRLPLAAAASTLAAGFTSASEGAPTT